MKDRLNRGRNKHTYTPRFYRKCVACGEERTWRPAAASTRSSTGDRSVATRPFQLHYCWVPSIVRDYTLVASDALLLPPWRVVLCAVLFCCFASDQTPPPSSVTVKLLVFLGVWSDFVRRQRFCMHASVAGDVKVKSSTKCPRLCFVLFLNVFESSQYRKKRLLCSEIACMCLISR